MTRMIALRCSSCALKRSRLGVFAGILLPLVHFLLECPRFLFVCKGKTRQATFELKRMEKGAVLVVYKVLVDFLVPYYTSICGLLAISILNSRGGSSSVPRCRQA